MKILTNFRALDFEDKEIDLSAIKADEQTRNNAAKKIFEMASEVVGDNLPWARLCAPGAEPSNSILFGCIEPELLIALVEGWNCATKEDFVHAMTTWLGGDKIPAAKDISTDYYKMHDALIAMQAIGNKWSASSKRGIFEERAYGSPFIRSLVSDKVLEDIRENPEQYVILTCTIGDPRVSECC